MEIRFHTHPNLPSKTGYAPESPSTGQSTAHFAEGVRTACTTRACMACLACTTLLQQGRDATAWGVTGGSHRTGGQSADTYDTFHATRISPHVTHVTMFANLS
jgi:hypothetical protein